MDDTLIFLILGMAAVTYGPRLLPFLFFSNTQIPRKVDAFLKCIPVAAIGALIIPGILTATPDIPMAGLLGMGFTAVYGFYKGGIQFLCEFLNFFFPYGTATRFWAPWINSFKKLMIFSRPVMTTSLSSCLGSW